MTEPALWVILLEWFIRIGFSLRVIMRREPVGVSLAWLAIILLVPFFGACVYFLIGEKRLGSARAKWSLKLHNQYQPWRQRLFELKFSNWTSDRTDAAQFAQLVTSKTGMPPLAGNHLQLMDSPSQIFDSLVKDIDSARHSCYLEYYIWETGGSADDVANALMGAAERGVDCRVLVDAVGSRGFLRSKQRRALNDSGVQIREALPSGLIRGLFYRFDLRLHRKIVVVDRQVAYVGSQNMADPKKFHVADGFGQWVDAMARLMGPAVDALSMTFYKDWQLENLKKSKAELPNQNFNFETSGKSAVQVVPSGPGIESGAISQSVLNAIYMADHKLCLTTPYFVPDELLQTALLSAAGRGIEVTIVVPEKVNSVFVELASRTFLRELAEAGVNVARYQAGLLHTKSVVVDDDICMFGSLNLDPRSLHLNFEITLMVYDQPFTHSVAELQARYLEDSRIATAEDLTSHSLPIRIVENCIRLLAPLL